MAWELWKSCNDLVFNGRHGNSKIVVIKALNQAWKALGKKNPTVWGHLEWPLPLKHLTLVIWRLPTRGWIKMNFDGALSSRGVYGEAGFVIRNFVTNLLNARIGVMEANSRISRF